jgi:hypothetical protein
MSRKELSDEAIRAKVFAGEANLLTRDAAKLLAAVQKSQTETKPLAPLPLDKLHEYIQTSMGWRNSHLHHFDVNGDLYAEPELMEDDFHHMNYRDSTITLLSAILPEDHQRYRFRYRYDFGDSWDHEILFEGCPKLEKGRRYPLCVEGERACPPEDVGGTLGYAEFLETIADRDGDERTEVLEWADGWFDPDEFDAATATKSMWKGLPDWRNAETGERQDVDHAW